jgi:hypothetical protein
MGQSFFSHVDIFCLLPTSDSKPSEKGKRRRERGKKKLTIRRQRIRRRPQAVKMIPPLPIRPELPPQIIRTLIIRILKVVLPITRRLPDIHHRAPHALSAPQRCHLSVHQRYLSAGGGVLDYAAA